MEISTTMPSAGLRPGNSIFSNFARPQRRPAIKVETRPSPSMFNLDQIEVGWDADKATLWAYMRSTGRPNFNPGLLSDFRVLQADVTASQSSGRLPIRYLVLGSRFPGVFNLGGDLDLFADAIERRDHAALLRYGHASVEILYKTMTTMDVPIVTIGLVQGEALGGGFEALLAFNVVIAERGARFGLPETLFGLFPGMGAHCFLSRRLGSARAERMILSGAMYTAEELYELGIVHVLANPGEGEQAVRDYISQNSRRQAGHCAIYKASRAVNPITLAELEEVVEVWADAAMKLTDTNIKLMRRLVSAQTRLSARQS